MNNQREERTENVFVKVTPIVKKEFELVKDNKALQESIIKTFLTSERDWLNEEIKEIDNATIKYSAKLLGIKEAFSKVQETYIDEIVEMKDKAEATFKSLDNITTQTKTSIEKAQISLLSILKQIDNIDFYKIERLLELVDKVNSMSDKELELLKKLLA